MISAPFTTLLRRQGDWRSDLLWRVFGLSLFEHAVLHVAHVEGWPLFSTYGLQFLFPAAVLFMLGGSRSPILLAGWALTLAHYLRRLEAGAEVQVGEEFGVYLALPLLGLLGYVVATIATKGRVQASISSELERSAWSRSKVDDVQVALFRAAVISTLLWAALHKLNTDFLDPSVSCGPLLANEITQWWRLPLPSIVISATPWQVIVTEGLCPFLLLLWPHAGLLWTTLVVGVIGQRGASAFAMLAVALALAALDRDDGRRIANGARRGWPLYVTLTLCLMVVSAKTYTGLRAWYEFMFLQVFLLQVLYVAVGLMFHDAREALSPGSLGSSIRENLRWRTIVARLSPGPAIVHVFIAAAWLAAMLNGLSPYLGWKYRLSFAMLSNLRVDDARWNSLWFPKALRLSAYDPFVHVKRLRMDVHARQVLDSLPSAETRALVEGLVSPMSLEYRMRYVKFHQLNVDIDLEYQGQELKFRDVANNAEFDAWLATLPKTLMIQGHLVDDGGPQPCTH